MGIRSEYVEIFLEIKEVNVNVVNIALTYQQKSFSAFVAVSS